MKTITIIILCLLSCIAHAQNLPNSGFDKVRIVEHDKVIQAELKPVTAKIHLKKDLFYTWYGANTIHSTQGGFSGRLLNGRYDEYYPDKSLKAQGTYKNGLKTGPWKDWKEDGVLVQQKSWIDGVMLPDSTASFWKKMRFFKKHNKPSENAAPGR